MKKILYRGRRSGEKAVFSGFRNNGTGIFFIMRQDKILNIPAIRRMPTYLHKLLKMQAEGRTSVSSTELAEYMHIELIVVRKDISLTGISGQRRVGYDVNELISYIKKYLGNAEIFFYLFITHLISPISCLLINLSLLGTILYVNP